MAEVKEKMPLENSRTNRRVPVGRFAPSPTGRLHRGNLLTALLGMGQMEALGGIYLCRIEDIDGPRTVEGAEQQIYRDLERLGIRFHGGPEGAPLVDSRFQLPGPFRQSEREEIYWGAMERLAEKGWLYPCTCSRKDLQEASAPMGRDGVIYPGRCRPPEPTAVSPEQLRQKGVAWRFRTEKFQECEFRDSFQGTVRQSIAADGDFVVRRRDGLWAYQLACAVDDGLMKVTHVLRGEDLLFSTGRQIALQQALDLPSPDHWTHIPLLLDETGEKLGKRHQSMGIPDCFLEEGTDQGRIRVWLYSGRVEY